MAVTIVSRLILNFHELDVNRSSPVPYSKPQCDIPPSTLHSANSDATQLSTQISRDSSWVTRVADEEQKERDYDNSERSTEFGQMMYEEIVPSEIDSISIASVPSSGSRYMNYSATVLSGGAQI